MDVLYVSCSMENSFLYRKPFGNAWFVHTLRLRFYVNRLINPKCLQKTEIFGSLMTSIRYRTFYKFDELHQASGTIRKLNLIEKISLKFSNEWINRGNQPSQRRTYIEQCLLSTSWLLSAPSIECSSNQGHTMKSFIVLSFWSSFLLYLKIGLFVIDEMI